VKLRFTTAAETDLAAALMFYETQAAGLGSKMLAGVNEACSNLLLFPGSGRAAFGNMKKTKIARFPFGIVYRVEAELIVVYAVVDLRRDPDQVRRELDSRDT
jgi:hypothetical protein